MRVTDIWRSLENSVLITGASIVLLVIIHSMAGYALGRNMGRKKKFKMIYFYIVSGMFVPFAILMMPLVKQTSILGLDNMFGAILLYTVFYMPMNVMLYSGYMKNVPLAMEEAADIDGASAWRTYWTIIFPMMKPIHATVAILTARQSRSISRISLRKRTSLSTRICLSATRISGRTASLPLNRPTLSISASPVRRILKQSLLTEQQRRCDAHSARNR